MSANKGRYSPVGSAHADEENLPLYEELQVSEAQVDALPPKTATADEVRDYLTSLLKNKRGLPEDQVRRIVSHWTIGTGRELQTYTPQMYLSVFGSEDGWALYSDVRLEIYRMEGKSFWERRGIYIFPAVSFTLAFILVMLLTHDVDESTQALAAISMLFVGMACICSLSVLLIYTFSDNSPETKIENELKACTRRELSPKSEP
ncbi:hypothetical protein Q7P37_003630 [Cladosporium fusiforme]